MIPDQPGRQQQPLTSESFLYDSEGLSRPNRLDAKYDGSQMYTKLPVLPVSERESHSSTLNDRLKQRVWFVGQIILFVIVIIQFIMMYRHYLVFTACSFADAALMRKAASSTLPDYYQTSPELFAGTQGSL